MQLLMTKLWIKREFSNRKKLIKGLQVFRGLRLDFGG